MDSNEYLDRIARESQKQTEHLQRIAELQKSILAVDPRSIGFDVFSLVGLLATPICVKNGAGLLFGFWTFNSGTANAFLKFYNYGNPPAVGTASAMLTMGAPAGSGAIPVNPIGVPFSNGLWVAATTGAPYTDTTAPGANEITVAVFYK